MDSILQIFLAILFLMNGTLSVSENITISHRGSYGHLVEPEGHKTLEKRGLFDLSLVSGGAATIIQARAMQSDLGWY